MTLNDFTTLAGLWAVALAVTVLFLGWACLRLSSRLRAQRHETRERETLLAVQVRVQATQIADAKAAEKAYEAEIQALKRQLDQLKIRPSAAERRELAVWREVERRLLEVDPALHSHLCHLRHGIETEAATARRPLFWRWLGFRHVGIPASARPVRDLAAPAAQLAETRDL